MIDINVNRLAKRIQEECPYLDAQAAMYYARDFQRTFEDGSKPALERWMNHEPFETDEKYTVPVIQKIHRAGGIVEAIRLYDLWKKDPVLGERLIWQGPR